MEDKELAGDALEFEVGTPTILQRPGVRILPDDGEDGRSLGQILNSQNEAEDYSEHFEELARKLDATRVNSLSVQLNDEIEVNRASWEPVHKIASDSIKELGFDRTDTSRSDPFPGASSTVHPLFSQSIVDFQSQAMGELFPPNGPARGKVVTGDDKRMAPELVERSRRQADLINTYVTEITPDFYTVAEKVLSSCPQYGASYIKVFYDAAWRRITTEVVKSTELIRPYHCPDLSNCMNYTHEYELTHQELRRRQLSGVYLDLPVTPVS